MKIIYSTELKNTLIKNGGKLMKLEKYFKKFDSEIGLNPTRKQRIESAYETWKEKF